jgi:F-type H+-transporting ATPase subunit epsilon
MPNTINFQLVTPEKTVLNEELVSLTCPTEMGQITILPGHIPLVANLAPGELHAKTASGDHYLYVAGGFVEVRSGNEVVILADDAQHHHEIDIKRAEEAVKRAEQGLKEQHLSGEEYARVAASLHKSLARANVARKHAHRRNPITGQGTLNQ